MVAPAPVPPAERLIVQFVGGEPSGPVKSSANKRSGSATIPHVASSPAAVTLDENSLVLPAVSVAVAVTVPVRPDCGIHHSPLALAVTVSIGVDPSPWSSPASGLVLNTSTEVLGGAVPRTTLAVAWLITGE